MAVEVLGEHHHPFLSGIESPVSPIGVGGLSPLLHSLPLPSTGSVGARFQASREELTLL